MEHLTEIFAHDEANYRAALSKRFPAYIVTDYACSRWARRKYTKARMLVDRSAQRVRDHEALTWGEWFEQNFGESLGSYVARCQVALKAFRGAA